MSYLLNCCYLLALLILSPWILFKIATTTKYRRRLGDKFFGRAKHPLLPFPVPKCGPTVWFHGVSVGEIHMLRQLVGHCRKRLPHWNCVVSTTTDTGLAEAAKIFADLPVITWPLDFSWAVKSALRAIEPDLVVLGESEIWPNFLRQAKKQGVRLALVNGRMSPRSAERYRKVGWLARSLFRHFDACAVQTEEYANHWRGLGANRAVVTGNIKYDGANTDRDNPKTRAMRTLLGIPEHSLVFVAGSTQAPEEERTLEIYRAAQSQYPHLRFILVPRQKDRFDEVAELLRRSNVPFLRRSHFTTPHPSPPTPLPRSTGGEGSAPVILLDTIGELNAIWGLSDVAFVGGSLDGKRGGQNMIEPAAYGSAVVFGPHTWNFKDTVQRLLDSQAAIQVSGVEELQLTVLRLLANVEERRELGRKAQAFVRSQQGATDRTCDLLVQLLENPQTIPHAA